MGRNKRLNYGFVVDMYRSGYGQTFIGKILGTPSGHISKVLRYENVEARKKGEKVNYVTFDNLNKELQDELKEDEEVFNKYKELTGYQEDEKGFKEMNKEEKAIVILDKLENGLTTREAAEELGIAQSTLVKTKNKYLKEQKA